MQEAAYEFPRMQLPRTPVNRGEKKGWGPFWIPASDAQIANARYGQVLAWKVNSSSWAQARSRHTCGSRNF